ncbi:hypothetical protein [Companilactobacillus farciminis]|uniref:hypothetical protein n=1 Tax=Companilactobacillus farciminis TaxID=1612 RepID=UPI0023301034|nr:hypothetical protein [Companilactobacillus farciminis]WCG34932.1 hypothetical protein PML84_08690 [Companilactobacillus farciminis]
MDFTGSVSDTGVTINLEKLGTVNYYSKIPDQVNDESIFIVIKNYEVIGINLGSLMNAKDCDGIVELILPENIIPVDFFYFLTKELTSYGYMMNVEYKMAISPESLKVYQNYWNKIAPLMRMFGLKEQPKRKTKARHRFVKELFEVPFSVDYNGSKATVYWNSRNELIIKKGAILVDKAPLTKAGIVGFAGRFGMQLRQEHADSIEDNVLTKDVHLRSVNEVGTFLYFAGTNSWLKLISPEGKTLDELTIVK